MKRLRPQTLSRDPGLEEGIFSAVLASLGLQAENPSSYEVRNQVPLALRLSLLWAINVFYNMIVDAKGFQASPSSNGILSRD